MTIGPVRHNGVGRNVLDGWESYRSDRYGFEFLYPSDWTAAPLEVEEAADEGQAFVNPEIPGVKTQGWVTRLRDDSGAGGSTSQSREASDLEMNFVTEQGLSGNLKVDSGTERSSVTLTLLHNDRVYKWQGEAPQGEFSKFYQLFTYVANQCRVPFDAENA